MRLPAPLPAARGRLHASGIEVLLDVAYNHTAEGDDKDPYVISFRGLENKTYYMMSGKEASGGARARVPACLCHARRAALQDADLGKPAPTAPAARCPQILNYSGCGNTVNVNHPMVMQLVLDSLVKWVTEYHVDGFRFDLASCMCRGGW